jgi:GT2 family glycosyltransferase
MAGKHAESFESERDPKATSQVVNSYWLFLGREPESDSVVGEAAMQPVDQLLQGFLTSAEFQTVVLPALASGSGLPHFRSSRFASSEVWAWAAEALPLSAETIADIQSGLTWRALLLEILLDVRFVNEGAGQSYATFMESLEAQRAQLRKSQEREFAGQIDEASSHHIRGWAVDLFDLDKPQSLELYLDNIFVGVVRTTEPRPDVQEKIGGHGRYGFSYVMPAMHHELLRTDRMLTVREAVGGTVVTAPLRIMPAETGIFDPDDDIRNEVRRLSAAVQRIASTLPQLSGKTRYPLSHYDAYCKDMYRSVHALRSAQITAANALRFRPLITVLITGENATELTATIASLRKQTYSHWHALVAYPGSPTEQQTEFTLESLCAQDGRVRACPVVMEPRARALNEVLIDAEGEYLLRLHQGDLLADDALFEIVAALQDQRCPVVYFDSDLFCLEDSGEITFERPLLRTALDRDLLLSCDYLDSEFMLDMSLFRSLGGFREEAGGAFIYDLALRSTHAAQTGEIRHLDRILYHRRNPSEDRLRERGDQEAQAREQLAVVNAHFDRLDIPATAERHADEAGVPRPLCRRIRWRLPQPAPAVSIIIPTRDRADLLVQCIDGVQRTRPEYPGPVEIVIVDNDSHEPETFELFRHLRSGGATILTYRGQFNWSAMNNMAARRSTGDVVLFLNNDTAPLLSGWLPEMVSLASRPDVGAVGARLLYADGTIQHGGVVLGAHGGALHEDLGRPPREGGYLGRTALQRNVSAVTGACMATRKELFCALSGFDETSLKVAFNDVDYCLRVRARGLAVVYTPFATLYHYESKTRGADDTATKRQRSFVELACIKNRWPKDFSADPFYNLHFDRSDWPFASLKVLQPQAGRLGFPNEGQEFAAGYRLDTLYLDPNA